MRRSLIAVAAALGLSMSLLAAPAVAHDEAFVVKHGQATPYLQYRYDTCSGAPATAPPVNPLERPDGTAGASAMGWQLGVTGSEYGPTAAISGPSTLSAYEVDVLAPAGTSGHAMARLTWNSTTTYLGWANVSVGAGGWQHLNLVGLTYDWDRYDNGVWVQDEGSYTLQAFTGGADALGVELGVLLGCGGEAFYLDRLRLVYAGHSALYDFEAVPPPPPAPRHAQAHLDWSTNGKDVELADELVVGYKRGVWMLGHSHGHDAAGMPAIYDGPGTMYAKRYGKDSFTSIGTKTFTAKNYAGWAVYPTKQTTYQFVADAAAGFIGSTSEPVTVHVQRKVKARVRDTRLVQGQRLTVVGKIRPGDRRIKVTLQRKAGRRWVKMGTAKTRKRGAFSVSAAARQPGTWPVRLKVASGKGNVGTLTGSAKVVVKRYVRPNRPPGAPAPPPPPPDSPADPTPTAPDPVATQSAPSTTPAQPPRNLPTGRVAGTHDVGASARPATPCAANGCVGVAKPRG